jgi:hypothetical protein
VFLCFMIAFAQMIATSSLTSSMKSKKSIPVNHEVIQKHHIMNSMDSHTKAMVEITEGLFCRKTKHCNGGQEEHDEEETEGETSGHIKGDIQVNIDEIEELIAVHTELCQHAHDKASKDENKKDMNNTLTKQFQDEAANCDENKDSLVKILDDLKHQNELVKEENKKSVQSELFRKFAVERIELEDIKIRETMTSQEVDQEFEDLVAQNDNIIITPNASTNTTANTAFSQLGKKNLKKSQIKKTIVKKAKGMAENSAKIAKACTKGFLKAIPPAFCYKKNGDWGNSNFACSGYSRGGALFYKHCNAGYRNVAGVCWADCRGGYTDIGALCSRCWWYTCGPWWFRHPCLACDTYAKHSYVTHIKTILDSSVYCTNAGHYKAGALCYRNCARDDSPLVNCGIGACAGSTGACIAGIITMLAEFLVGLVSFVLFVASFGSAGAGGTQATGAAGRTAIKKLGSKATHCFSIAKKVANNPAFRRKMMQKVREEVMKKIAEEVIVGIVALRVAQTCEAVGNEIFDKVGAASGPDFKDFDLTGTASAISTCNDPNSQGQMCAKAIMNVISLVDPTGLVTMAGSLIQPICDK